MLPVERMRRWVAPADINGTGSVTTWTRTPGARNTGADAFGRVEFTSYFRPPGAPGVIASAYAGTNGAATPAAYAARPLGTILFPQATPAPAVDPFYAQHAQQPVPRPVPMAGPRPTRRTCPT